jgi:hypothetical protein
MVSSAYQKAITLNNQGVVHFESGNYEQARLIFRDSLEGMKLSMADQRPSFESNGSSQTVGFQWSKHGPLHSELNIPAPGASSFIFRRALIIVPASDAHSTADLPEESTAIIYNVALAYMLSGHITNCSSLLEKSRKFFEIVVAMRKRRNECDKLDGERLLDTAICNNLGWLNTEFCDYTEAQHFFEQVSTRLVSLSLAGFVEKQDCEGFITNLVVDPHPNMAAAA